MPEQRACIRIREGGFFYLLAVERAFSIEHRSRGGFELMGDGTALHAAWHVSGSHRVPVFRLGILLECRVGQWEYVVLLSEGERRLGIAAAHVQLIPEPEKPVIQAFNPVGATTPGGRVITGVCPHTQPEYLVLDLPRLQRCLQRAGG